MSKFSAKHKVKKTLESCVNLEQLKVAHEMFHNYEKMYGKDEDLLYVWVDMKYKLL